jgi:hypothetical protein
MISWSNPANMHTDLATAAQEIAASWAITAAL